MAEKKINGRTFRVSPLLATKSMILKARLMKAAGPALSNLGNVLSGLGKNKTMEQKLAANNAAVAAFSEIFSQADPLELATLIKDVLEVAQIERAAGDYGQVDFDGDFTEHERDIIPVMVFVLGEQFGDFFAGLPGIGSLGSQQGSPQPK